MKRIWHLSDAIQWFWSENNSEIGAVLWSFVFAMVGTEIVLVYGLWPR